MTETFSKHRSKRNLMEETHVPTRTRRHNPLPTRADDTCHDKELSSPWNSSKHHSNQFPKWAGKGGNNTMIYRDNSEADAFSKWSELKDNRGRISRDSSEKSQSPNRLDMEAANRDSSKRSNWGHQPPKWLDMEAANNESNKSSNWGHQSPKWLDTDAANKDRSMSSNWGHQSPKCSDVEAANKDSSKSSNQGCRSPKWSDIGAADKDSSKAPNLETVSGGQTAPQDVNFNRKNCGRGTALDNTGFDAWRRCSSSISPRGGWNRSYRSRSRSPSYGSKRGSESQVTKARIEMGGSAAPCRDFAAGRYGRGSQCRYLHVDGARRYSDNIAGDIRESKRGKYSGHDSEESFTDSWERGDYSRDRRPQRHGSDFSGEDKHELHRNNRSSALCYNFLKGRCHRGSRCKYVHHDASSDGGRFMKDEAREGTYDRRDSDTSCGQRIEPHRASNIPCKYFAEGHCRRGEDCSFSHQGTPHGRPEGRSSDHKWGYNMETDNSLSWNGAKLGDRTTTKDAPRSSRWRSDGDKWGYNKETDNGLSWNGPKRGDETTTKDAPNFSRWRSEDVKRGHNTETANSLSWNGPKWGDETTTKGSPNSSQWRLDADKQGSNVETDNSLSWNGPKWGDQTTAKDAANSSRWGSDDDKRGYDLETDNSLSWNGPKWGDHITAKDAPNSSQWRLDDDKQNYNVKTGNSLLQDDPKGGDQTTTKDSPNSSQRRSDDDRRHDNVKTDNNLSRNGSKWGDQTTTKDATSSSPWSSAADKWGYNVETDNSSSWNGPKWGDQTTANDAPNSSRWRSVVDKQGYNVQTDKTSWIGPKWGDNRTTKDAPKSSQWRSDDDQLDYNVKSDNSLSRDGPKWGDQTTTKVSPNSSQQRSDDGRRDYNVKTDNSLSRNGSKWGDQTTTEDAPNSSLWRSNADEQGYNMEGDDNSSQNGPKWGDQTTTKDAPNSSQWRSDDAGSRASTTHSMGIEDATHKPLHPSSENPEQNSPQEAFQRALPSQEQNITQEPAGKDQHVLIISQTLSRTLNFDLSGQNGQDQQSINLSEKSQQTLFPPPHEGQNQYTAHSIAPNGQDAIPQLPSNQQSLKSDRQSHQVICLHYSNSQQRTLIGVEESMLSAELSVIKSSRLCSDTYIPQKLIASEQVVKMTNLSASLAQVLGNGKQLPQLSATLNPLVAEPSAAAAAPSVQPNSKSWPPEPVSADFSNSPPGYSSVSVQTKNPTTVEESQTASKSFAPSSVTGEPNNGNLNKGANLEEKLHRGYQEPKQVELSGDTAKEVNETETGQSMKEQSTAPPKDADADGKTDGNSNRNMGNEKGIRMFKFALVEFVKDILKPSWKEGHLSKEAHKTIVKKVVDKVTGTLQGSNIPQTQENIDLYLSYSKTKLTNLVQAYLEKYAKS